MKRLLHFCIIVSSLSALHAAERVALIIGNCNYQHFGKLDNPKQDHDEMTSLLSKELGFTVVEGLNLDTAGFRKAIADFAQKHSGAKEIVFYFSGHGMQVQGENYLTGVDSTLDSPEKAKKEAALANAFDGDSLRQQQEVLIRQEAEKHLVPLSLVLQYIERMGAENAVRVVILDSCRDNPIGTKSALSSKGLKGVDPPSGMLIAFAAREGRTALQTETGKPSLYTGELLKQMRQPGLPVEQVFKATRAEVVRLSSSQQVPAEYSLLTGDMFFMRGPATQFLVPPSGGSGSKAPDTRPAEAVTTNNLATPTKDQPFVNFLGMKFVSVPGTKVLFCIHDTRSRDFATFMGDSSRNYEMKGDNANDWRTYKYKGFPVGRGMGEAAEKSDHPVVNVSWLDAKAFCAWLSNKEGRAYRLPTDHEWSVAACIGEQEEENATPQTKDGKIVDVFSWGDQWPPPTGSCNIADSTLKAKIPSTDLGVIGEYTDGYATTSPVMSFAPNKLGLYDMSGNVWQWCEDWFNTDKKYRVLRGGSWSYFERENLLSSRRFTDPPHDRDRSFGFRCVLVPGSGG